MPWVKLDDQFFSNPKVLQAGRDARDLYLASLTYCARHLTDGFVPTVALRQLAALADIDAANRCAERLVAAGLWEKTKDGYEVHDFLEYNPSRAEVAAIREARAEAGARGGVASGESRREAKAKQVASEVASAETKQTRTPSSSSSSSLKSEDARADARAGEVSPTPTPPKPSPRRGRIVEKPVPQPSEAVQAYREIMRLYPSEVQQRAINERVAPEQVPRWREAVTAWNMQGNKKTNVGGMLDWFRDGIPKWDGGQVRASPGGRKSNVEKSLEAGDNFLRMLEEAQNGKS